MIKATEKLLQVIYGIGEVVDCFTVTRSDLWNSINGGDYDRRWSKQELTCTLHNLNKSGYIKFSKNNNAVEFTNKAQLRIIDHIAKKIDSDSIFRFVSFDIPESMSRQRRSFRRALKRLGFVQIQKSLWVVNKNIGHLVELAAYEYNVDKYIIYITSSKTDIDGFINKKLSTFF